MKVGEANEILNRFRLHSIAPPEALEAALDEIDKSEVKQVEEPTGHKNRKASASASATPVAPKNVKPET